MIRSYITILLLILSAQLLHAQASVLNTISAFPYAKRADADPALTAMRTWDKDNWSAFGRMLDDDSNKLKASYALDAYVHDAAADAAFRSTAAALISSSISSVSSFSAKDQLIKALGSMGDDAAIPVLSGLLTDATYGGVAARSLATIGSKRAIATLDKAATSATGALKADIGMAAAHAHRGAVTATAPKALYRLTGKEKRQGFEMLFDGTGLDKWTGNKTSYRVEDGAIVVSPSGGSGGNLYTAEEYADFEFRFEFQLTPGANNGLGIRTPLKGDAAYVGMELQILDNEAEKYRNLKPYQYHGSVYGVIPAKRGFLKPTGEWNQQTVIAKGSRIRVVLNGEVILDGDVRSASMNGPADGNAHPGLLNPKGHIGFLGHGDVVRFRNIRVRRTN